MYATCGGTTTRAPAHAAALTSASTPTTTRRRVLGVARRRPGERERAADPLGQARADDPRFVQARHRAPSIAWIMDLFSNLQRGAIRIRLTPRCARTRRCSTCRGPASGWCRATRAVQRALTDHEAFSSHVGRRAGQRLRVADVHGPAAPHRSSARSSAARSRRGRSPPSSRASGAVARSCSIASIGRGELRPRRATSRRRCRMMVIAEMLGLPRRRLARASGAGATRSSTSATRSRGDAEEARAPAAFRTPTPRCATYFGAVTARAGRAPRDDLLTRLVARRGRRRAPRRPRDPPLLSSCSSPPAPRRRPT